MSSNKLFDFFIASWNDIFGEESCCCSPSIIPQLIADENTRTSLISMNTKNIKQKERTAMKLIGARYTGFLPVVTFCPEPSKCFLIMGTAETDKT